MRFLIAVIEDQRDLASEDEQLAIDAFNDRLRSGGHWLMACGLHLPETATVLDARGSMVHSSKGSLLSGEERFMSGFWIIEAASTEEALALAAEGSRSCGRPVEVRQLHGPAAG